MSFLATAATTTGDSLFQLDWIKAIGLTGNFCWFMRFFQQWIASERKKESVFPIMFWYWSLLGTFFLGIYFILKQDLPGILGYVPNAFIYLRNLQFAHRKRRQLQAVGKGPAAPKEELPAGPSGKAGNG